MIDATSAITGAMTSWHQAKLFVEHGLDISHDALHMIVGVLAWLVAALILRRPISSWTPWLVLAVGAVFNEVVDWWTDQWPQVGMQIGEGAKDFALTMLVPSLLMLAVRTRPNLFRQSPQSSRPSRKRK